MIDGVAGPGQFVGMYLAWGQNNGDDEAGRSILPGWGCNGRYLLMRGRRRLRRLLIPKTLPAPRLQPLPAREFLLESSLGIALVLAGAVGPGARPGLAARMTQPSCVGRRSARRIIKGAEHDLDLDWRQVEKAGAAGGTEAPTDEGASSPLAVKAAAGQSA